MTGIDATRRQFTSLTAALVSLTPLDVTGAQTILNDFNVADGEDQLLHEVAVIAGLEDERDSVDLDLEDPDSEYNLIYEAVDTGNRYIALDAAQDPDWQPLEMIPTNQLNEVTTENAKSFFNHTFARPNAPDTKNWNFTPADITKNGSEVELAATTTLDTTQRGNYPPGSTATPGIAMRFTGTPTAGEAFGGYATTLNGLVVGEDTTDSFVELRGNGETHRVYRTNWNGFVPDTRVWVENRPVITRMPHLFYGGGDLKINALIHGEDQSTLQTLHTFTPENVDADISAGPPIDQPNLPVRFESASLAGGSLRANACHYQFSLSESENRVNGIHYTGVSVGTSGWTRLATWQKRANWEMVNVRPLKIAVVAETNPVKVELQLNPSLSSTTTSLPPHTSASETAVEEITAATVDSFGERRWVGYVPAGQGSSTDSISADDLNFNLPVNQPVGLFAQAVGGSSTVSGTVAWEEFF